MHRENQCVSLSRHDLVSEHTLGKKTYWPFVGEPILHLLAMLYYSLVYSLDKYAVRKEPRNQHHPIIEEEAFVLQLFV